MTIASFMVFNRIVNDVEKIAADEAEYQDYITEMGQDSDRENCYSGAGEEVQNEKEERSEKAVKTVEKLVRWIDEEPGRGYDIQWLWNGQSRDGVIQLWRGNKLVAEEQYYRNTMVWGQSDYNMKLRTGSNKHKALMRLMKKVSN